MSDPDPKATNEPTGHYGAGYGEQHAPKGAAVPPTTANTTTAPSANASKTPSATTGAAMPASAAASPAPLHSPVEPGAPLTDSGDDAVAFTPDDVTARPPDQPPTEAAPASEKAGLIFERS